MSFFPLLGLLATSASLLTLSGQEVEYSRDIRPLLSNKCFVCHGPDESTREAGFRLDTFEDATADLGGYAPIVPGDLEASELWYRVRSEDPEELMPPVASHKPALTGPELDLIRRWIEDGAEYQEHWAFVPPAGGSDRDSSALDPAGLIDMLVGSKLAERGFEPSPRAGAEDQLRRLMLDLTGLPPSLGEIEEYSKGYQLDPEGTWTTWVERVLTEEPYISRFAERMATPWLDQSRYADTSGIHMDAGRQIWPWRDWVLSAYRDNMPFDQFLTEQMAGDLIPDATQDQIVASGFNRNHITTDEGGAIDAEYLVEYSVDRVSTTGEVFMGLTMGCARCHDHKFDPITQEDFYRFYSFFNSIEEPGLYSQIQDPNRAFEPFLEVPSESQLVTRLRLATNLEAVRTELSDPSPEEETAFEDFLQELPGELDLTWADSAVTAAVSEGGAEFSTLGDGSQLAAGANPATDVHHFTLRTDESGLRLLQLDVLGHESFANGAPGRADNGNAVLTSIQVEAVSILDPSVRKMVAFDWAWADFAQSNEDYGILRAFDERHNTGWAIAGHTDGSERTAMFMAAEPFGFEGGTEVQITLGYESIWAAHVFGRVRMALGKISEAGVQRMPMAAGLWYESGGFDVANASIAYQAVFGPELDGTLDPSVTFDAGQPGTQRWAYRADFADGQANALTGGVNIHYVAKEVWSPVARDVQISLGSDDGFVLFINGERVAEREVPRGVAPDQDFATAKFRAGRNTVVLKVINTGGQSGFYFRAMEDAPILTGGLVAGIVRRPSESGEPDAIEAPAKDNIKHAWRLAHSPEYKGILEREAGIVGEQTALEMAIPRTMVMRERAEPRESFVLDRGEYDKADKARPVLPGVPGFLSGFGAQHLPADRRATRLDLAHWMTDPENPLVARVAVNRIWQVLFGTGLVASSGDFGLQGSWPSHPELLDQLAMQYVQSGWNTRALIRSIVASDTYRQSSRARPEVTAIDPDGALLASYPPRRLTGEAIRDTILYVSGLLVEEFGGPSVKPYQPSGMWREIAMAGSNTRSFELGAADELYRRSLYTYWKRAAPPPALLTFDAPTRESCEITRANTNTPLQALALWNDEQVVEAARHLAMLSIGMPVEKGLESMFQRCTGRLPDTEELALLQGALDDLLIRYRTAPEDAAALLSVGATMAPSEATLFEAGSSPAELAAWTMVANAVLNLHATITQH
jgi:hypothetical protein